LDEYFEQYLIIFETSVEKTTVSDPTEEEVLSFLIKNVL
jgi:hypothetical protein